MFFGVQVGEIKGNRAIQFPPSGEVLRGSRSKVGLEGFFV